MIISSASFFRSINGTDTVLLDGRAHIVFVGRSNVGKSSVINSLVRQKLARSSKTPGKTKRLDFFLINNKYYFVDLPGYGFAHASGEQREHFRKLMMWYFEYTEIKTRVVAHIVDAVVGLTDFDLQMVEYLEHLDIPHIIIANKMDKLSKEEAREQIKLIQASVGETQVFPYSAKMNEGRNAVLFAFDRMI